ncbi:hypothetical protein evm_012856 [Chilo suppressalis]|nr:hypothetical protein evm_012856 [Chilo suppressalis]
MLLPSLEMEKLIQITSRLRAGMNFKNRTTVRCEEFYVKKNMMPCEFLNSQCELSTNFFERNKPQQLGRIEKESRKPIGAYRRLSAPILPT